MFLGTVYDVTRAHTYLGLRGSCITKLRVWAFAESSLCTCQRNNAFSYSGCMTRREKGGVGVGTDRGRMHAWIRATERTRGIRRRSATSEKSMKGGRRVSGTPKGRTKEGCRRDEVTTCGSQSRINYRSVSVHEAGP